MLALALCSCDSAAKKSLPPPTTTTPAVNLPTTTARDPYPGSENIPTLPPPPERSLRDLCDLSIATWEELKPVDLRLIAAEQRMGELVGDEATNRQMIAKPADRDPNMPGWAELEPVWNEELLLNAELTAIERKAIRLYGKSAASACLGPPADYSPE